MTRIARLLRAYHDASGLSWATIGQRCGMSSQYLHDLASGRRRARAARAARYAASLGLDVDAWVAAALQDELDRD